ncbi:MAG: TolC family protein [Planctomycetia bacterium]|nr:TolC family protein [Planctomycetia bacterium]
MDDPFAGAVELSVERLVSEILARNQSLAAMQAAWRAAAQRYPQEVSLADPAFMSLMAPGSFSDPNFQSSFMVGAKQPLPWPGKRQLRGASARAESTAAYFDAGETAVRLAALGRTAYYEYFLARRELELLGENILRLREFREIARARYETKAVTQQDMLQADVDLADLDRQGVEFVRNANIAVARINTLLNRAPDFPLPPPAREIGPPQNVPEPAILYQMAVQRRPDLAAAGARVRAEQARVDRARREYYPDFELGGRYDQFWDRVNQRGHVEINMNVPLYQARRQAAVREAMWRVNQRRAEYEQLFATVRNEVQTAYEGVVAAQRTVDLYRQRIIPFVELNVGSARAAYETGQGTFLALIEAQRQRIDAQVKQAQALAEYHRQLAELEQALGGPAPLGPLPEEVQPPPGKPAQP